MKKFLATLLALAMFLSMCSIPALADDAPVVTFYVRGGAGAHDPYLTQAMVGLQTIQGLAGVTIDWQVVNGSNEEIDVAHTGMLASGNYPDIIKWNNEAAYVGGINQMYNDGIIIELNDVIDQYMPNLKKILEENPDVANDMMNDNGQFLYFTAINPLTTLDDVTSITSYGLLARADWLENVGLEVPTNIDEWYEVLSAFKTMDPNGNGLQDEIPLDAGSAGHLLFMPAFDIMSGVYIDPATGKVAYGEYSEGYRGYLETMAKWYAEGLLVDAFADDTGAYGDYPDEDIFANLAGSWKGLANYWEQRLPPVLEKAPNADFVAVPWPADAQGKAYSGYTSFSRVSTDTVVITTSCKNIEAAARLIDTMYSEAGSIAMTWGTLDTPEEPGTYGIDENGNKYTTDWAMENIEFHGSTFPRLYSIAMYHANYPRFGQTDFTTATYSDEYMGACRTWSEASFDLVFPMTVSLSADEQRAATASVDDINQYIHDMQFKFITGQEPLTNFDNYIDTLQRMGIEDLIAAYQAAYDRYLARGTQK